MEVVYKCVWPMQKTVPPPRLGLIHCRIWEGSWADDALKEDEKEGIFAGPALIRTIEHKGAHFNMRGMHIVDPSPQRTPFLFQAGTSP